MQQIDEQAAHFEQTINLLQDDIAEIWGSIANGSKPKAQQMDPGPAPMQSSTDTTSCNLVTSLIDDASSGAQRWLAIGAASSSDAAPPVQQVPQQQQQQQQQQQDAAPHASHIPLTSSCLFQRQTWEV